MMLYMVWDQDKYLNLVGYDAALLGEQFLMCWKKPIALILNSPVDQEKFDGLYGMGI
jgi:hypothetical protein